MWRRTSGFVLMSLFSSAMSRGEVNNREVIRLPRAAIDDDRRPERKGTRWAARRGRVLVAAAAAAQLRGTTGSPSTYSARRLSPRPARCPATVFFTIVSFPSPEPVHAAAAARRPIFVLFYLDAHSRARVLVCVCIWVISRTRRDDGRENNYLSSPFEIINHNVYSTRYNNEVIMSE